MGYLRLKYGEFTVDAYTPTDTVRVYEASPKGRQEFDADERQQYLDVAIAALAAWRADGTTQIYGKLAPVLGRPRVWQVAANGEFSVPTLRGLVNTGSADCTVAIYAKRAQGRYLLGERTIFYGCHVQYIGDAEEEEGSVIVRVTGYQP